MRLTIYLVGFVAILIGFFYVNWSQTTKVITTGSYGPFLIGQTKEDVIATLREIDEWPVEPVVYERKYLKNPSYSEIVETFSQEAGVMIWVGVSAGAPLRIEFENDFITNTWPYFDEDRYINRIEELHISGKEYVRLQNLLTLGMSRNDAFKILSGSALELDRTVSNFVVGEQYFRELSFRGRSEIDSTAYRDLILANNAWKFYGLKEEIWYSSWTNPFYSTVTLYFESDRLERIEHWYSMSEVP